MELIKKNGSSTRHHPRMPLLGATLIGAATLLAACGGGSSDQGGTNSAVLPTVTMPKSCSNVAGNLDAVQTALIGTLAPAAGQIPVVGGAATAATTALSRALDAVDGLTGSITTLTKTSNPQTFTASLSTVGDSLLCSGSSLSDALARVASSSTVPVPGLDQVQLTLADVAKKISLGLVGQAPGGDLSALTNQLVGLSNQLKALSGNLPAGVNQPYLSQILALNATTFGSLSAILTDVGQLNSAKLSSDIVALLNNGANALPAALAGQSGLPTGSLSIVTTQFQLASQTVGSALTQVTGPAFQAIGAALGATGSSIAPTGAISDLLVGALPSTGAATPRVTQLTQLLNGGTGLNSLVALLTQAFGGKLPV